ncbi:MAG: exonuclease SbcCD subunit D [Chloroflexi bacterium]|nr:MAG: exonuclease SbcCD subunit D [Chloroflexota bacterium]
MRFLHTSDWHVGKPIKSIKRDAEYAAALAEVLDIAKRERVDCILVAGDIFDSVAPPPEAERIVFDFLRELIAEQIPAVMIAGNHDNPRRLSAFARVLEMVDLHVRAEPQIDGALIVEVASRDKEECAIVAALPWVPERKVQDFDKLWFGDEKFSQYAQGVAGAMKHLAKSFRSDRVNILMSHVLLDDSKIADVDRGERALHTGIAYTLPRALLPAKPAPQYIALGHVHMPQEFPLANAYYSGSLLQVDFGEAGQEKRVNIVDISPGQRARVEHAPLKSIRQLRNLGTAKAGVTLEAVEALAAEVGDAYLKVFLKADRPAPGLAQQVREIAPNAVQIETVRETSEEDDVLDFDVHRESPAEAFTAYYRGVHAGNEPPAELMALFNRLYEEVDASG